MRRGTMTFRPHNAQKFRVHGFRARMMTKGGRKVLVARRVKDRVRLTAQNSVDIRAEEQRDCLTATPFFLALSVHLKLYECKELRGMRHFPSIRDDREFRQIYESGGTRTDRNLVFYLCFRPAGDSRIGISTSKKVGNNVVRYRVTRVLREILRLHHHAFTLPCDLIFAMRKDGVKQDYRTSEASFLKLCRARGILEEARC